jgi:acyl-CoA synthetase (NDP forming)
MTSIAIIGASSDRSKFGNKAVRAYRSKGFEVFPINPKEKVIEGLPCYPSILKTPKRPDMASLYLPPAIGIQVLDEIAKAGVKKVYINPGADSPELIAKARGLGLEPLMTCSILAIGIDPNRL